MNRFSMLVCALVFALGSSLSFLYSAPVFVPMCNTMTVYVKEPVRFNVMATVAGGGAVSYSVSGVTGATINAATGQFAYQPEIADEGVHTATFTASNGTSQATMTVVLSVVMPSLGPDQVTRVLRPVGGMTYYYGDTINIAFVTLDCSLKGEIDFWRGQRSVSLRYMCRPFIPDVFFGQYMGIDSTRSTGEWISYKLPEKGINLGFYRMPIIDLPFAICDSSVSKWNFGSNVTIVDSMWVGVRNQYATPTGGGTTCQADQDVKLLEFATTDTFFTIAPSSQRQLSCSGNGAINRRMSRHPAGIISPIVLFSVAGNRIPIERAGMDKIIAPGVYVIKSALAHGEEISQTLVLSAPRSLREILGRK
jgi:hypothetical protein